MPQFIKLAESIGENEYIICNSICSKAVCRIWEECSKAVFRNMGSMFQDIMQKYGEHVPREYVEIWGECSLFSGSCRMQTRRFTRWTSKQLFTLGMSTNSQSATMWMKKTTEVSNISASITVTPTEVSNISASITVTPTLIGAY